MNNTESNLCCFIFMQVNTNIKQKLKILNSYPMLTSTSASNNDRDVYFR